MPYNINSVGREMTHAIFLSKQSKNMKRFVVATLLLVALSAPARAEEGARLNAVKTTFLSWATGSTKISYERALPEWQQSGEICTSLISAGYDKYHNNPLGFTLRYGHKFFVGDYSVERPFDGFYVRPEFIFSRYHYDSSITGKRALAQMGTLLATAGYQKCWGRFIADAWFGGGYALGTPAETGYHHGFALLDHFGLKNDNIAFSFSIRVGFLF